MSACVLAHYDPDPDDPAGKRRILRERPTTAMPGTFLCRGHYAHLEQIVAEMPALHDELEQHLAGGSQGGGPKVSGNPETALPFHERAAEHLRVMNHQLVTWTLLVAEERRVTIPVMRWGGSPGPILSRFLLRHQLWIVEQLWVEEYVTQLRDLRTDARSILSAVPRRQVDLGPCAEDVACNVASHDLVHCDGILRATVTHADEELPAAVVCTVCGKEHPSVSWRALARKLRGNKDSWLTGPQLSEMWRIPFSTVRRWASEDAWRRHPDGKRPTRFHADDAVASFDRRRSVPHEAAS